MSRRGVALVVAGVCLAVALVVAWVRPVPYVAQGPGLVQDTLGEMEGKPLIAVEADKTYPTQGRLDFTTVSVTRPGARLTLGDALMVWLNPDRRLVPRDLYYPPDQTVEEAEELSTLQMSSSQDAAAVAALREMGYDVALPVAVLDVSEGAPAGGHLRAGDVIRAVEGKPVRRVDRVSELLQSVDPGDEATITVRRSGSPMTVTTPTEESSDEPGRTVVGVQVGVKPKMPFKVRFHVDADVGGPSAGLMFALSIVDRLTPGALTGGLHIAGTGEIGVDGSVGAIGGVGLKIAAAEDAGATVFLVPAGNCTEAASQDPDDIRLVRVTRLSGAVTALERLAADEDAPVPECASG
ncbi:MAG: PDZ domain-containing protein [Propionibacteriales bacterium]|nr:PDZ domain-containing protein [Propionibacteriales bacterium]